MNSREAIKLSGISDNGDVDLYWEDLDRYWHLPSTMNGKDEPGGMNPQPTTLRRRQMRRAQRAGAAMVSAMVVR